MIEYIYTKQLNVKATVTSGGPILTYDWKIDDILQPNNTDTLIIPPNTLSLGLHTIKFRGQNYCGNWSSELIENINIIEVTQMEKTVTVVVDQPVVQVAIALDYAGTAEVTVSNGVAPVAGASLDLDGTPTGLTTGADGKASILNVPYGTHTVKATKV